jgi:hypothetical protein
VFARSDEDPVNKRCERTDANGREASLAVAMQKVVGSSPIIRSPKALQTRGFRSSRPRKGGGRWNRFGTEAGASGERPARSRAPVPDREAARHQLSRSDGAGGIRLRHVHRDANRLFGDGDLLTHFATDDEAREHVEPILRAWERADAFTRGSPEFRFDYESVDVIDRAADPGANTKELRALVRATASVGVDLHVQRAAFPKPPDRPLALTPDVETLWNRWLGFLANREPLSSFAYFVHTVVCLNRSEREAASALGVAGNVIETLRAVSSYAGGRKGDALRPHTATEETWLKATVPILIRRVAEVAADPRAREPQITLADLPPL